jgi:uncharacterized protein (DUF2164 family)
MTDRHHRVAQVDRIADYLKAQNADAEIAQRDAERFQNRHKAAEKPGRSD